MTPGIPSTNAYIELLTSFPPRPITSEDELITTQKVIDSLIDQEELTSDEQDYSNVLGTLVHEYEEKSTTIPDIHGVELLKALIDEFGLPENDLVSIFTSESIVSEVLSKKRPLTVTQVHQLAEFFHISPAAFFESTFLQ
ncbi:MAG: transcriptional regulator [Nostocaceae cyanobacterium]|nr:transcriptional regulator [Nostocaceae cyanobacterium]